MGEIPVTPNRCSGWPLHAVVCLSECLRAAICAGAQVFPAERICDTRHVRLGVAGFMFFITIVIRRTPLELHARERCGSCLLA